MFSKEQITRIEQDFIEVERLASGRAQELFSLFSSCTTEEMLCMKFLYSYMPLSDLTNYNGSLFLEHIRHCLNLKALTPWGKDIEAETFLNFILPIRVNNENLEFYGRILFDEIYPYIKDMDIYNAALEVNYWCYSRATYTSSDSRTISPLTMLLNTQGRCGEESTFTVACLRSVGIPARQCYTPRWSACDDNHAWVEVYVNSKWHFMGACEPEPALNRGWFEEPARRCMLTHSRVFSRIITSNDIICTTPKITEINSLSTYAKTKRVTVFVHNGGEPVFDATVRFEIVNYAELFPLAKLTTDKNGVVSFLTGYGDLFIHVHKDEQYCYGKIDVRQSDRVDIDFSHATKGYTNNIEFDIVPPEQIPSIGNGISSEQKASHELRLQQLSSIREAYQSTFYNEHTARTATQKYEGYDYILAEALVNAKGNYKEIEKFLDSNGGDNIKWKAAMLSMLNVKDLWDTTSETLSSCLKSAIEYKDCYEEELFINFILCPRVYLEMLSPARTELKAILGDTLIKEFRDNPSLVGQYVKNKIVTYDNLDYNVLYAIPDRLLRIGKGSRISQKILMVYIYRTAGIPARLNPIDLSVEYYSAGIWYLMDGTSAQSAKNSSLTLKTVQNPSDFKYMTTYSIAVLSEGYYKTLDIKGDEWEENYVSYTLAPGNYRILTSGRQADGTVLANAYHLELNDGCSTEIDISIRKPVKPIEKGSFARIEDIALSYWDGRSTTLRNELMDEYNIVAWIEVCKEPTEHLLNELLESSGKYNKAACSVILILPNTSMIENTTLKKVLKAIPLIKVLFDNGSSLNDRLYSDICSEDRKLPLAIVCDKGLNVSFVSTGYNIGCADAMLKSIQNI